MNWESSCENILCAVGHTPMVKLNKVGAEYPVQIYAKCEFLNPGGSVKDRAAIFMIQEAENQGKIKPGDTLIEATSGNMGIGLAMACAVKGYKLIICMPEKMSMEKQVTMEALGATIVRTPTEAAHDDPNSNFGIAKKLNSEIPNSHILDQFWNQANPQAHFDTTATEILTQMNGQLDFLIAGIGTGGTITGIARKFKSEAPNCQIVAADPYGSIMGGGTVQAPYAVEGIGYDFIPGTYDPTLIHHVVKTHDNTSFNLALRLIREEGLLVGGSSGSAMEATLEIAKTAPQGSKIVVILPDGIRNYMSKFLNPTWMAEKGFKKD